VRHRWGHQRLVHRQRFGGDETDGVDWVRWIVAIIVAAVLVVFASTVSGRNGKKVI
jgi:hypothetical protein